MAVPREPIEVTEQTDWSRLLDDAMVAPVLLRRGELDFRLQRDDPRQAIDYEPDPERVRQTLAATIGSWADLDIDQVLRDLYEARRQGSRSMEEIDWPEPDSTGS